MNRKNNEYIFLFLNVSDFNVFMYLKLVPPLLIKPVTRQIKTISAATSGRLEKNVYLTKTISPHLLQYTYCVVAPAHFQTLQLIREHQTHT